MCDSDDTAMRKRIAAQFTQGTLFSSDELFTAIHTYSLYEIALIVMTYHNEATAFLLDANGAMQCMHALIANINRHLSDDKRACFNASLTAALEGCTTHDEEVLDRLPAFAYVPRNNRVGIHITFPFAPPS